MIKIVSVIVLGLLGYGLLRLLSRKDDQYEQWKELDRGDGFRFKDWR